MQEFDKVKAQYQTGIVCNKIIQITKANEVSWNYSCDNKVSLDREQILTLDFSGRIPPPSSPLPTSPPPYLPPIFPPSLLPPPSSQIRLRPVVALYSMRLALRILRPRSLTLTLSLLISFSSLSSLSPLSLSLILSRLSVSLLSQEDPGKEPHIKDSSPLPPKRTPCFFLPRYPPLSHSRALTFPPRGLKFLSPTTIAQHICARERFLLHKVILVITQTNSRTAQFLNVFVNQQSMSFAISKFVRVS